MLQAGDEIELVQPDPKDDGRVRPDPALIEKAAALLAKAELPVIYVGGGALAAHASAALQALAEKLQAPVVMSENGRGALSDHHPLALTALAGRGALRACRRRADRRQPLCRYQYGSADVGRRQSPPYIWLNLDPNACAAPRSAEISIEADACPGSKRSTPR